MHGFKWTYRQEETFVLDFMNTAEDIEKGFQPFYDRVTLSKETDANQLYNIRTNLDKFAIHEAADLEAFANEWFSAKRSVQRREALGRGESGGQEMALWSRHSCLLFPRQRGRPGVRRREKIFKL